MKTLLIALSLLAGATRLFAQGQVVDGAMLPGYQELVREGYGPHEHDYGNSYAATQEQRVAPMPTQAYYGNGYTIYYGFTPVPDNRWYRRSDRVLYAFGYPADFYRKAIPGSLTDTNLERLRITVQNPKGAEGSTSAPVQQARTSHGDAVTTVQKVSGGTATAAAGQKMAP